MRVFVTGASGWIGSAVVDELLAHGHDVLGLVRSDAAAQSLVAKGAQVHRGDLDDPRSLAAGAEAADAVIHLANKHDFDDPATSNRAERGAVEVLGDALVGTDRPLFVASGAAGLATGRPGEETDPSPAVGADSPRGGSENLALSYADRGVRPVAVRFAPTVHGTGDHGFVAALVRAARERGVAGYVGDGSHRWSAVHRTDAARLVRLALEQPGAGVVAHAVAEEGVTTREIAELIGAGLGLPVEAVDPDRAVEHFGWIGRFFALDMSARSNLTSERYGWTPTGPTLADDLRSGGYTG
ncbi:SDR family oxidoreductase [Nocardioides flavescens]|uniref:NAD-dependent epimerase/dehydratase family protein n=1 Tax=Nocardioides flavescens TaxID=2691959 RepID=A0A6L7EYT3_9ACTN|nr:SDR family oxidoreductase [Nocardioides flavescens]MXG89011.1 NAD-dependent epimerase/dehydratase family protein [Nocardioides flavescens]